jgi:elongation factor Ts
MGYRAAVIVSLNKGGDEFLEAGKNVSMQIAAMKPIAVGKENVSQEVINREIEVRTEVLRNDPKNAGKPDEMLKKIVEGSLNKFFQEVTLLQQDYVKGNKETVAQYLETVSKGLTVLDFKHFALK